MTIRRPLLTAVAAGSVLFALWFVPSANASVGAAEGADTGPRAVSAPHHASAVRAGGTGQEPLLSGGRGDALAATGGPDTTPYVIGGAACLALGAGLVRYSVRRPRNETC